MTNTGGPAFPTEKTIGANKDGTWITEIPGQSGMTLRDYFAAKAMHHWLSLPIDDRQREKMGNEAYKVADAMLKAREA